MASEPTMFEKPISISRQLISDVAFDVVAWQKTANAILQKKEWTVYDDPEPIPSRLYNGACKIIRHPDSNKITTPETWEVYKGFRLGFTGHHKKYNPNSPPKHTSYFLACWLRPWDDLWEEGSIAVDTIEEVLALARQCIDYLLVVRAMERTIGRRLESHELPKPEDLRELQKEETSPEPATD